MEGLLVLQECIFNLLPHVSKRIKDVKEEDANARNESASSSDDEGPSVPDYHHPVPYEKWSEMASSVFTRIMAYMKDLSEPGRLPVQPQVEPGSLLSKLPKTPPEKAESFDAIMKDMNEHVFPGLLNWQHACFFGYFPLSSSLPAILAEMFAAGLSVAAWDRNACPVGVELEVLVLDWVVKMLGLSEAYLSTSKLGGGCLQSFASESIIVAMLGAKAKAMNRHPPEDCVKLVAYCSDQAHSSVTKAGMITGIIHFRTIPTTPEGEFALPAALLEQAIEADRAAGLLPFFINATIGTTSSCAVDDVVAIGKVAEKYNVWLHVDAAHAGPYAVLESQRADYFQGLEHVDSYDLNPHKAMLSGIGCAILYAKDMRWIRSALSITPEYLRPDNEGSDCTSRPLPQLKTEYNHLELSLGTPLSRALRIWFVLRMYGVNGIKELTRHRLQMQDYFVYLLSTDKRFTLIEGAPPRFGLVCFKLANGDDDMNEKLLHAVNRTGKAFIIHTKLDGHYVLRMAIGSTLTQKKHIKTAWLALKEAADSLQ